MDSFMGIVKQAKIDKSNSPVDELCKIFKQDVQRNWLQNVTWREEQSKLKEINYHFNQELDRSLSELVSCIDEINENTEDFFDSNASEVVFRKISDSGKSLVSNINSCKEN